MKIIRKNLREFNFRAIMKLFGVPTCAGFMNGAAAVALQTP
jgi:hypothetical protein